MQTIPLRETSRRIIIWDPSPTPSSRFIMGYSSSINLYDWDAKEKKIRMVGTHPFQTQQDGVLKCLAWSPHPAYSDLVAAANTNGRLQLLRLNSVVESHQESNTLSAPVVINFTLRPTRPCNALAFSPHDPNYLAVGADKFRSEAGLTVWDVETAAASLPSSRGPVEPPTAQSRPPERVLPLRPAVAEQKTDAPRSVYHHGTAEMISSLAFLPHTPTTLVVGAGRYTRVIDMRLPTTAGSQQLNNKFHNCLCVDPFDDFRFASFGEDAAIRVWDRRFFTAKGPLLCFTEADAGTIGYDGKRISSLSSISFSPTRRGLLASLANDDNPVRMWTIVGGDYLGDPSNIVQPEYSKRHNSLSRVSPRLNQQLDKNYFPPTVVQSQSSMQPGQVASFCFATTPSSSIDKSPQILTVSRDNVLRITSVPSPSHHLWSCLGDLAVSHYEELGVRHVKDSLLSSVIEPWDIAIPTAEHPPAPPFSSASHSKGASHSTADEGRVGRTLSVYTKHSIEFPPFPVTMGSTLTATRPPKTARAYSPSGLRRFGVGMRATSRTSFRSPNTSPTSKTKPLPDLSGEKPTRRPRPSAVTSEEDDDGHSPTPHERDRTAEKDGLKGMTDDMSMTMRRRVLRGYGLANAIHNASIVSQDPLGGEGLSNLWTTLAKFIDILRVGGTAVISGFDFSHQGLFGIWEGFPSTRQGDSIPQILVPQMTDSPSTLAPLGAAGGNYRPPSGVPPHRLSLISHSREPSANGPGNQPSYLSIANRPMDFDGAVDMLNERRMQAESGFPRTSKSVFDVETKRSGRRKLALALCEWDFSAEDFFHELSNWEAEGHSTRAACWATLIGEYALATEYLMRSNDDLLHIVSGTVSALIIQRESSSDQPQEPNPWRESCQKMINRLSDPYLRIMLSHLIGEPWTDILQDEAVLLTDRLGIIFRFVDDDRVSAALRKAYDSAKRDGDLDGLLFAGLTPRGMDVIQAYVDNTGDVQTAAILASYVSPARFQDTRVERWLDAYRNLLDTWQLFHFRCQFDIERGQMLQHYVQIGAKAPFEWVDRQLFIRCNYCNTVINSQPPSDSAGLGNPAPLPSDRVRTHQCPKCAKSLPRCVICLMAVGINNDGLREAELSYDAAAKDTLDEAIVSCQTCRHGGHASHIFDWFETHRTCAVADCDCRCAEL